MRKTWFLAALVIGGLSSLCLGYSGGDGSAGNPYQIADKADLLALGETITDYGKCFILMNDIDLTGETFTTAIIAPDADSNTWDFQGATFTGTFDGNSHTINSLTITSNTSDYVSLFGCVGTGGLIKNLNAVNINLQGNNIVGGLAGINGGDIAFCRVSGEVRAGFGAGELAGTNYGTITSCFVTGIVDGHLYSGGLVGQNYNGKIINSCSKASVIDGTGDCLGGLVGVDIGLNGLIISSCATGDVTGTGNDYGGLVGWTLWNTITACYATGSVSGSMCVGGLIGYEDGGGYMNWCYSTGSVSGSSSTGGLIGFQGDGYFTIAACFWDKETSRLDYSGGDSGVQGKTTAQMKTQATFTDVTWDFTNETANGTNDYWRMCVDGVDYPRLNWESIDGDFVCPDGVSVEDLDYFVGRWLLNNCTIDNNYCGGVDVDSSGTVDLGDYAALAGHWLEGI